MISEFEQRLATVLGARLPAPFQGRVEVAPGTTSGLAARVLLGVQRAEPLEPDFHSIRPELVPGAPSNRRILRLRCQVMLDIRASNNGGRAQQVRGLEAAMYELDAPDFRNGAALTGEADPGFVIQQLKITDSTAPLDPNTAATGPVSLTLSAEGLFWPVGVPGQSGIAIGEIRVRGVALPVEILPLPPVLTAGGAAFNFTLRVQNLPALRLVAAGGPGVLPFGRLAFGLVGPGGKPGAGVLSGGSAGVENTRLVNLTNGEAVITYTPPPQPAQDQLVVTLDNGENGPGLEIGRFPISSK